MSVLERITRFLGRGSPALVQNAAGHGPRSSIAPLLPRAPVRIEVEAPAAPQVLDETEEARAEAVIEQATLPTAPKNKQELLAELRRNYAEAVHLIRKVDSHLDEQGHRSQRLVELGERTPEAIDHLEAIRNAQTELADRAPEAIDHLAAIRAGQGEHSEFARVQIKLSREQGELNREQIELMRSLGEASREGRIKDDAATDRQRELLERQTGSLGRIEMLFEQSQNTDRELGAALGEFRGAVAQMNMSNHRLGGAIERLDEREQGHERRIDSIAERGRVVTNMLIVMCGLSVATALVAVMTLLYLITR